jgi:hypothetical protein
MKVKGNEQSIENGARQKKRKKLIPAGRIERGTQDP